MTEQTERPDRIETDDRRPWVRPRYVRARAGEAEVGPNPDTADGAFTFS